LNLTAGYQMGTRLRVKTDSGRQVGLRLTQKGPVVGIEASW
jgi:urease accessory protein UreE